MRSKLAIVIGFLIAAAAIVYATRRGSEPGPAAPGGVAPGAGAQLPPQKAQTEITLVYGTEKKAWLETAVSEFAAQHADVKVNLVAKGSLDAAQAILEGELQPTMFSPADTLVLELLASDYRTKNHAELFAGDGDEDAPQQLLLSPLVFVVWEDRASVLMKTGDRLGWKAIHDAVVSPRGWLALGGKPEWGFVKLGHTDPTRSNSGLQALLLMTLEHWNKREGLQIADLLDPAYQKFVTETEKGVSRFEASTGTFMEDMVRFGPSKYDIAVVYESLAIEQIANAQGRWGNLRVYYPGTTIWSDHPLALLRAPWVSAEQRSAARALAKHLRSRPVQQRALDHGFRPADPAVPIKTSDPQNPWNRLAPFGLQIEVPPVAPAPEGTVIRNMLMMWARVAHPG